MADRGRDADAAIPPRGYDRKVAVHRQRARADGVIRWPRDFARDETRGIAGQTGAVAGDDLGRDEFERQVLDLQARARVDQEIIAHLEAEGVLDRAKIANLEVALIACRRIGAAIGVLMALRGITDEQAFDLLRAASQRRHVKLRLVAEDVLRTGTMD